MNETLFDCVESLVTTLHNVLSDLPPLAILPFSFVIFSSIFRFFKNSCKFGFAEKPLCRDIAIREFRELVDSSETDSKVWYDFWERNDEFRDDIMKLKG